MLNYIRKAIDGKISSIPEVEDPAERPSDMLYHAGLTNRMMNWSSSPWQIMRNS